MEPDDPPFTNKRLSAQQPYRQQGGVRSSMRAITRRMPATLTTCCSNNYGPYRFPEKMIPLMILNAIEPVIAGDGDGLNERDWLFVAITARDPRRA